MVKRPNIVKGLRKLNPLKHPRDSKGRFVETPDPPKVTIPRKGNARSSLRQQGRVVASIQNDININRQRDQLANRRSRDNILAKMTPEQGRKLAEVLMANNG